MQDMREQIWQKCGFPQAAVQRLGRDLLAMASMARHRARLAEAPDRPGPAYRVGSLRERISRSNRAENRVADKQPTGKCLWEASETHGRTGPK